MPDRIAQRVGRHPGSGSVPVAVALLLTLAAPAAAIDGRIDLRATRQSDGAGDTAYRTDTLLEDYKIGQRFSLGRYWLANFDLAARREQLEGRALGLTSHTETTTLVPTFAFNYRRDHWQGTVNGRGLRRDWSGTVSSGRRDENVQFGAWLRGEFDRWELDVNLQEQATRRQEADATTETREHNQTLNVRRYFGDSSDLRYTFDRNKQDLLTRNNSVLYLSNQLQFKGLYDFADRRGQIDINALASLFEQTGEATAAGGQRLLQPVWGGFSLDDTPGYLDPLEPDPLQDERLHDTDRDVRSAVNIGDSAVPVQRYGGDWRNIIFDFGGTEQITSATLYVDARVGFPGLIDWLVYVSDDSEGRDWGDALDRGSYSMVYQDLANGRQGWQLTFAEPIAHRRLKIVDVKYGLTEPDIYVTEWEVYGPADTTTETVSRTAQGRFRGGVTYDLLPVLELRYYTQLEDRRYLEEDERLTSQLHLFGLGWQISDWRLLAQYQLNRLESPNGRDTDANSQTVSLVKTNDPRLQWRFSYIRTDDRSYSSHQLTNTVSADGNWRIYPRLTLNQKFTYGERDAEEIEGTAHSWSSITTLRGDIRTNIVAILRRSNRWSDQEAGSGFSRFNDTDWNLNWTILPLVTLVSQVNYKVREEDQLIFRHTLSWAPLPGGSVGLLLYANDYQDTRTDYLRRGAGAMVTWKPRPRLRLETGAEQALIKQDAQRNTPVNLNARGSWTF